MRLIFTALLACASGDVIFDDTGAKLDTQDSAPGETGETGETGEVNGIGEATRTGAGTASLSTLTGTHEWALVDEAGADLCRVSSTLTSTNVRVDCDICAWAFDLILLETVEVSPGGCAAVGIDPAGVDGTTRAYGYVPDYFGHAQLVAEDLGDGWDVQGWGAWDDTTGVFSFLIEDGEVTY